MYNAAVTEFKDCHAAILCAAVADFRPISIAENKIKREKIILTYSYAQQMTSQQN